MLYTDTQAHPDTHGDAPNLHPHRNILEPEAPPLLVVVLLGDASIKHPPAPLVNEVAEGDKGDLVECYLHQKVDILLCQGKGFQIRSSPASCHVLAARL